MTRENAIKQLKDNRVLCINSETEPFAIAYDMAIKALEQEPRKGKWLRMSDLSEQEDDRYKCSRCGNVIHHKNKMNLYTFNSWCGRCGSDNSNREVIIEE